MLFECVTIACPECGNADPAMINNAPVWYECRACGYYEDSFKGPLPTLTRRPDPDAGLIQYL